ncbi:MAG: DUF2244 domain-containing protein [Pseudomonadota bacterium]
MELWPHNSLSAKGFVTFMGITSVLIAFPLLGVFGTNVLWGLLPFLVITVSGLWYCLNKNYRDREIREVLTLSSDTLSLSHRKGTGAEKHWHANPYWVDIQTYDQPVEAYLTLRGGGREVELGSFLTPEERRSLDLELRKKLRALPRGL